MFDMLLFLYSSIYLFFYAIIYKYFNSYSFIRAINSFLNPLSFFLRNKFSVSNSRISFLNFKFNCSNPFIFSWLFWSFYIFLNYSDNDFWYYSDSFFILISWSWNCFFKFLIVFFYDSQRSFEISTWCFFSLKNISIFKFKLLISCIYFWWS